MQRNCLEGKTTPDRETTASLSVPPTKTTRRLLPLATESIPQPAFHPQVQEAIGEEIIELLREGSTSPTPRPSRLKAPVKDIP